MAGKAKGHLSTTPVVFTANRLRDGRVVWLGAGDEWVEALPAARIFTGDAVEEGRGHAQAAERRHLVVGAYEVEVEPAPHGPQPLSVKERIRMSGPSVGSETF